MLDQPVVSLRLPLWERNDAVKDTKSERAFRPEICDWDWLLTHILLARVHVPQDFKGDYRDWLIGVDRDQARAGSKSMDRHPFFEPTLNCYQLHSEDFLARLCGAGMLMWKYTLLHSTRMLGICDIGRTAACVDGVDKHGVFCVAWYASSSYF